MKPYNSKYPKNSGFKVPKEYFANLEDSILDRLEDKDFSFEVKKAGFEVPAGYFDSLEDRIIAKAEIKKTKVIKLYKREYLYYAAAIAILAVLIFGDFNTLTSPSNPIGWDDVEVSAIENYIDEGYEMGYIDLNTADYSEYIFDNGKLVDDDDFNSVNAEAALEYIDENIEDPNFILD